MKKITMMMVASAMVLALGPQKAEARGGGSDGWLLGFDLSYISDKEETTTSSTSSSESATTFYDVNLGYTMPSGLYVGGIYASKSYSSSGTASVSTSASANAMGAVIGYGFMNGMYLNGIYFLSATDQDYKKGSGMGVELGWRTFASGSFFYGAKLSYRSLKYTENTTVASFNSLTKTIIMPMLSLGFTF